MKPLDTNTKILIVGLGVIGGSYARALSRNGYKVRCITKEQKDIDYALSLGMIEEGSTEVTKEAVEWADLVVFALYHRLSMRIIARAVRIHILDVNPNAAHTEKVARGV